MSRNIRGSYASECEDFYNVTSCNLVQRYEHFTGIRCLHFQGKKVRPLRAYILYSLLLSSVNFLRSLVPILPLCTTVMFFVFFFTLGLLFYSEDGRKQASSDAGNFLPDYNPRRQKSSLPAMTVWNLTYNKVFT